MLAWLRNIFIYFLKIFFYLYSTSLGTQRCPGESQVVPPFTHRWSIFTGNLVQNLKTKLRTFPWVSSSPIKIRGKSVKGFLSYDRPNKQAVSSQIVKHKNQDDKQLGLFKGTMGQLGLFKGLWVSWVSLRDCGRPSWVSLRNCGLAGSL